MPLFARLFGARGRISEADLDRQRRSAEALRHGQLPLSAQERLDSDADELTFTSDLTAARLAALRSAGWQPAGQAFGAASFVVSRQFAYLDQSVFTRGRGVNRAFQVHGWFDAENRARDLALRRLLQECRQLGGDGVVGVRRLSGLNSDQVQEFSLVGTAVRSIRSSADPERAPFVTALSGSDVAALERGGWRPVALAFARACWTTGGYSAVAAGGRFGLTRELPGMVDLQNRTREQLRRTLEQRVRSAGGRGLLLHGLDVLLRREDEGVRAEGDAMGTVIAPLGGRQGAVAPSLVLRLDGRGGAG